MTNFNPLVEFNNWFLEARSALGKNAEIAALGMVNETNRSSVRMINYKGQREGGLSFFTNFESEKGEALRSNPVTALTFFWPYKRR